MAAAAAKASTTQACARWMERRQPDAEGDSGCTAPMHTMHARLARVKCTLAALRHGATLLSTSPPASTACSLASQARHHLMPYHRSSWRHSCRCRSGQMAVPAALPGCRPRRCRRRRLRTRRTRRLRRPPPCSRTLASKASTGAGTRPRRRRRRRRQRPALRGGRQPAGLPQRAGASCSETWWRMGRDLLEPNT